MLDNVTTSKLVTTLHDRGFAVIVWSQADVATLRPTWTKKRRVEALERNRRHLEDRSVEAGWEVLETLLDMDDAEKPE